MAEQLSAKIRQDAQTSCTLMRFTPLSSPHSCSLRMGPTANGRARSRSHASSHDRNSEAGSESSADTRRARLGPRPEAVAHLSVDELLRHYRENEFNAASKCENPSNLAAQCRMRIQTRACRFLLVDDVVAGMSRDTASPILPSRSPTTT